MVLKSDHCTNFLTIFMTDHMVNQNNWEQETSEKKTFKQTIKTQA